jgi:hypothetical protein
MEDVLVHVEVKDFAALVVGGYICGCGRAFE